MKKLDLDQVQKYRDELNNATKTTATFLNRRSAKMNIAQTVSSNFDVSSLLQNTIYMIPNSRKLYIDYSIFKLYANPSNYDCILHYFMDFFKDLGDGGGDEGSIEVPQYEFHINMQSLTASACERYNEIILRFFQSPGKDECLRKISKVVVYNTPSVIDILCNFVMKMMNNENIIPSVFYDKKESPALLEELLGRTART